MDDQDILKLIRTENAKLLLKLKTEVVKPTKILRYKDVKLRVGFGINTIKKFIDEGKFPQRMEISGGICGWLESDIDNWIKEQHRNRK